MKSNRYLAILSTLLLIASVAVNGTRVIDAASGMVQSLYGGTGGTVVYQSAANTTAFLANGTAGQVLTSNGTTLAPSWTTNSGCGSGTTNTIIKFTSSTACGDSTIQDSGSLVEIGVNASQQVRIVTSQTGGDFAVGGVEPSGFSSVGDTTIAGDWNGTGFQTRLELNDTTKTFAFRSGTSVGVMNWSEILNYKLQRVTSATTGNRTINLPAGLVTFAAAANDIVVTNSLATTTSLIFCTVQSQDTTAISCSVTDKASGSFHIRIPTPTAGGVSVAFWLTN